MKIKVTLLTLFFVLILQGQDINVKRYKIKSGIINYEYSGSTSGTEILYFDDFGLIEAKYQNLTTTVMGMTQNSEMLIITKPDFICQINLKNKSGVRIPSPINNMIKTFKNDKEKLQNLGLELTRQMGGKKTGSEVILGKNCDIWKIMGSKISLWNGLPLKTISNVMGMNIKIVAKKIDLDKSVPKEKFEIPAGIKVRNQKSQISR